MLFLNLCFSLCFFLFHPLSFFFFFFFNDTATTEIYTLSLHDALPISQLNLTDSSLPKMNWQHYFQRSEEHTSELQSPLNLVCRLLLEKKKKKDKLKQYNTENVNTKREERR